jgi:alpha-glucosidase (family GH31 glycosyl hydrolase)
MYRIAIEFCILLIFNLVFFLDAQNVIDPNYRIDCHPDFNVTQAVCANRGCVFDTKTYDKSLGIPLCYYPNNTGYVATNGLNSDSVSLVRPSNGVKNPFGSDFDLVFTSKEIGGGLYVSISPKQGGRYRPPIDINLTPNIVSSEKLKVVKSNNSIFSFAVQRQSSGANVWDTSIGGLLFADQFIQISTYLPSDLIYGFGEHLHQNLKHNFTNYTTWGMFARDNGFLAFQHPSYGVHPFYLGVEKDGKAHGVFIYNSNAQEITTGPAPHLTYRTIGGQLEFFYFPGPTPEEVIKQYNQVIGTTEMPAYWALGFHLCRFGYHNLSEMQMVVNRTLAAQIPIDVAWADIQYAIKSKDFTLDNVSWAGFTDYINNYLHRDHGMYSIVIVDPGIEVDYEPFSRGLQSGANFIRWYNQSLIQVEVNSNYTLTNGTDYMLSIVWPERHVAFPDFLEPTNKTTEWWMDEFRRFRKLVPIDGVWIDMNEIATCSECPTYTNYVPPGYTIDPLVCPPNSLDNPPYLTSTVYQYWEAGNMNISLASKTICMAGKTMGNSSTYYNTKSLYGNSMQKATARVQREVIGKRGTVISRSTFPTSGKYGGHWTGDDYSNFTHLRLSIIQIQEINMFGIPFVGADICGFNGVAWPELCLRWQQLGAFYPFSRNHNVEGAPAQDPGLWPDVAKAARHANLFRYRHLPYLYSLLFSSALYGGTVARPVFFEFANDSATYDLSFQFLWGSALMIIPVTYEGVSTVDGYLPKDAVWYSVYDNNYGVRQQTGYSTFWAPKDILIPVFVRGGYILPRQVPDVTTKKARQHPFELLIALDLNGKASGELYWDDGETNINDIANYNYYHFTYNFYVNSNTATLNITMDRSATNLTLTYLDNIEIFGYPYTPSLASAKLNGQPANIDMSGSTYNSTTQFLSILTANFINLNQNGPTWILTWSNGCTFVGGSCMSSADCCDNFCFNGKCH